MNLVTMNMIKWEVNIPAVRRVVGSDLLLVTVYWFC